MRTLSLDIREQRNLDNKKLRDQFGGDDGFMSAHQTKGVNDVRPRTNTPDVMMSDAKLRKFLVKEFPQYATNPIQYRKMVLWANVIYLYWRMGEGERTVAFELRELLRDMGLRWFTHRWKRRRKTRKVWKWKGHKKILVKTIPGKLVSVKTRRSPIYPIVQQIRRRMRDLRLDGKPRGKGRGHRARPLVLNQQ